MWIMWFCSIISHVNLLSLDFLDLFNSLVPLTILLSSYCLKYTTYTYNIHKVRSFTNLVSLFEFHFEISIQSNLWNFHTYLLCGVGDSSYIFAVPLHLFSCHMCFITLPSLSHTHKKMETKTKKRTPPPSWLWNPIEFLGFYPNSLWQHIYPKVKVNMLYLSFEVYITLFHNSFHVYMFFYHFHIFNCLIGWRKSHCAHAQHFHFPFVCWWTPWLSLSSCYCESGSNAQGCESISMVECIIIWI